MQLWEESDVLPALAAHPSEAVDQLCCLLGRSYPHRSEGTEEIEVMIALVQSSCPVLQSASEVPTATGKRHRIDCDTIC